MCERQIRLLNLLSFSLLNVTSVISNDRRHVLQSSNSLLPTTQDVHIRRDETRPQLFAHLAYLFGVFIEGVDISAPRVMNVKYNKKHAVKRVVWFEYLVHQPIGK